MKQKPKHSSPHHTTALLLACHVIITNGPFEPDVTVHTAVIPAHRRRKQKNQIKTRLKQSEVILGYMRPGIMVYIYNPRAQEAEAGKPAQIGSQAGLHGEFKTRPDCTVRLSQTGVCVERVISCCLLLFQRTWKRFGPQHPNRAAHNCL